MAITDLNVTNQAVSTTTGAINAVDDPVTFSVASGDGNLKFPSTAGGKYFYVVVVDGSDNYEIMKVTSRTGDSMTADRAQQGTTKLSFSSGAAVEMRITAQDILDILGEIEFTSVGAAVRDAASKAAARTAIGAPQLTGNNVLCPHEGLTVTRASAATVDIDADALLLTDASGNQLRVTSVDLTVNLASSGALGLDTGSEANSTWYHLWVLAKADGTVTGVLSTATDFGSVTLPADYVYGGYVGAVYNSSSGDLFGMFQRGRIAISETFTAVSNVTGGYTNFAIRIPATATRATGYAFIASNDTSAVTKQVSIAANSSAHGLVVIGANRSSQGDGTGIAFGSFAIVVETPQQLSYSVGSGGKATIYITGWEF